MPTERTWQSNRVNLVFLITLSQQPANQESFPIANSSGKQKTQNGYGKYLWQKILTISHGKQLWHTAMENGVGKQQWKTAVTNSSD